MHIMKIFKVISAIALISMTIIIAVACRRDNELPRNEQENDISQEMPIEDEELTSDDRESEEQETPVIIENDENKDINETDPKKIIAATSDLVINAIREKDAVKIAEFVHPLKGVRFTPYTYVSLENDIVFTKEEMLDFFEDTEEYLWGYYDGTGDDIKLTPSEYYDKFIYSADFQKAPEVGYNEVLSFGNALENQFEVYESPIIVEYYFPGFNEEYEGMDWKSLRLVFESYEDSWKLVGIIHNQWTI